jgi:hypothetical protein
MQNAHRLDPTARNLNLCNSFFIERNIPLSTHLFKAGYTKRQRKFKEGLLILEKVLLDMPDFTI